MTKDLLTRSEMAEAIGRSPTAVYKAIRRLKIKPAEMRGSRPLFASPTVEKLRENMRTPNRNREEG